MNRKNMPLILMLVAGAITCVITFVQEYSPLAELVILFVVLVVFYGLGSLLKWTLDYFDGQNEKRRQEEGEVIEKEAQSPAENGEESAAGAAESTGAEEETE